MADDWFKVNMDIFSNRKIKYLRRLRNGDSIALFWVALLAEARRCNSDGQIFLTESMPYTTEILAEDFGFEESTVKLALDAFDQLNMIYTNNGFITIAGWEDHQNAEGLAKIREQNRERQARFKARQKNIPDNVISNVTDNVTITLGNATDKEEEKETEKEIETDNKKEKTDFQSVVDLFHRICVSYPKIRSLSEARKKAIKARLNTYTQDEFRIVFENAEASSFLKGKNDRNWQATFDWLIKDTNMAKVLEGNYADRGSRYGRKEKLPGWFEAGDAEMEAIAKVMKDDPAFIAEQEQLRKELQAVCGKGGQ